MLLQQFQYYFKKNYPFIPPSQKFLLAVSGGIDSVVMTDLFFKSGFDFVVAHCNFQLREEESIRDELFVRDLGGKYNKEVLVKRFDTKHYADEHKVSIQEAARALRYEWFEEMSRESIINHQSLTSNNKLYLSTAHNADDNIETMLMFLFRGTGITGLTGINDYDKERKIMRPLLFAARKEISAYAGENNVSWVVDSSNAINKYTRNFFRNVVIPGVEKQFPNTTKNLTENIHRFKETEQLYMQAIDAHKKKLLEYKGNEIHIPVLKLQKIKPLDTVLWEIIKAYNFHAHHVNEIKKLFTADNSSYVQSSSHRVIKNRNWLIIAPNETEAAEHILIEANDNKIKFVNGVLEFETFSSVNYQLSAISSIAQFDAKQIEFPLLLRKRKQGDYFYPLGMSKKKKLSRFFIDEKLSATEKENIRVLEMNKKIIWIVGYRIDNRFKITASTKTVLKIKYQA